MLKVRSTPVGVYVMGNNTDVNLLTTASLPPTILGANGAPDCPHVSVLGSIPTLSSSGD